MGVSLAVGGLILSAIGTGISVYAQSQAASSAAAIAEYNANQQEQEAAMQLMSLEAQAEIAEAQAHANFLLSQAEAEANFQNARSLRERALANDNLNREDIRRRSQEFARFQAEQRAVIASSGVVETSGTPLDIIAETAAQIQTDREDMLFLNEVSRNEILREADLQQLGGELALAGATLDRDSQVAGAGLQLAAGRIQNRAARREIEFTRMSGRAESDAHRIGALTSLFSGASSIAATRERQLNNGALGTSPKPAGFVA